MSRRNHPIEQEELMAYLDGELATSRAVEAAAHLEHCTECQEFTAALRKISQGMMTWEVAMDESKEGLPVAVKAALQDRPGKPRKDHKRQGWKGLFTTRRLVWGAGSAVAVALFISIFSFSRLRPMRPGAAFSEPIENSQRQSESAGKQVNNPTQLDFSTLQHVNGPNMPPSVAKTPIQYPALRSGLLLTQGVGTLQNEEEKTGDRSGVSAAPMIARTVGLVLTTKEFDKTRTSLEEILKRHNGYFGEMNMNATAEVGRSFTATLRIPAAQLDAAMAEMKQLGRVEKEAQGGEEVTQQYVDLQARLANSQHTEQRLTQILQQRTGKLQDVLKVELEIDRVRGEIEQMQAEKKELTKRVAFATLNMTVQEEYQARLQGAPPSTGSKFRNAAVDGYNTVVETFISIGLFLLSAGPSLLIWFAILFFPARFAWKKWRAANPPRKRGDAEEE